MSKLDARGATPVADSPSVRGFLRAFYLFARPHTILGTSLSVLGLTTIALAINGTGTLPWGWLVLTLLACLAANIMIVGLNQLTDVEIDRINKPELPLASGAFSLRFGRILVIGMGITALLLALPQGVYLTVTVVASMLIGIAYSLPPIRLKRFHFWAAACIFVVRGVVVNILLFLHLNQLTGGADGVPAHVWALTAFMLGLSLVIAWFKDVPDTDGDSRYAIRTLALRLGRQRVFVLGLAVLVLSYGGMIAAGVLGLPGVNGPVLVVTHAALLAWLLLRSRRVDTAQQGSVKQFYMFIWALFFAEYLLFPLACVLA